MLLLVFPIQHLYIFPIGPQRDCPIEDGLDMGAAMDVSTLEAIQACEEAVEELVREMPELEDTPP